MIRFFSENPPFKCYTKLAVTRVAAAVVPLFFVTHHNNIFLERIDAKKTPSWPCFTHFCHVSCQECEENIQGMSQGGSEDGREQFAIKQQAHIKFCHAEGEWYNNAKRLGVQGTAVSAGSDATNKRSTTMSKRGCLQISVTV